MAMSDLQLNHLTFDVNGFMAEFESVLNNLLDQLSIKVQDMMAKEIMANGNGSKEMRDTACQQIKEISRKITATEVELVVGIDEDALSGSFSDQVFVRTMVVLHGNVTAGPLMAVPNKMAWDKHVRNYRVSEHVKNAYILPDGMMQYEMVNGFGHKSKGVSRNMLDNIFEGQLKTVVGDFDDAFLRAMNAIDYSKYIIVG